MADRLKTTEWILASHSYGHIDFKKDSESIALRDTDRWIAEVSPIIGAADVFVYPFGAAPSTSSATVQMLRGKGLTILCDIDTVARLKQGDGVVVMSRRHIDGIVFANQSKALAEFVDVATVQDTTARHIVARATSRWVSRNAPLDRATGDLERGGLNFSTNSHGNGPGHMVRSRLGADRFLRHFAHRRERSGSPCCASAR